MDDNFFSNQSNVNNDYSNNGQFSNDYLSEKDNNYEFYDSLNDNDKSKERNYNNLNIISINNEDSVLQEAFNSLSNFPKKNKIEEKSDKKVVKNNYSIDNYPEQDNNETNIIRNNEDENVNLGVSYSKIIENEKFMKNRNNINCNNTGNNNNNKGIITPNTSLYNISDTITKNNGLGNNKIQNNNNNIFGESSLCENYKKKNISIVDLNSNQNEDENKYLLNQFNININTQFSNIKKSDENDINTKSTNNNFDNSIQENKQKKNNKKHYDIISKRFELLRKNKKQLLNSSKTEPINIISSNDIIKNKIFNNNKENETDNNNNNNFNSNNTNKIFKNSLINSINENKNYIYLCPYCSKDTPEIISLEGIQEDINEQTIDKISIACSCGSYELNLIDYLSLLEQKNKCQNLNEYCYNQNHEAIKASNYCSKCNKWFCDQCLIYHKSLLSDHFTTPNEIPKYTKCPKHENNDILYVCNKCNIGYCEKCKITSHSDHYSFSLNINDYFNKTYHSLPFKTFEELNDFIEHCNRISEKEKDSYIKYIEDMINKLNELKNNIFENYNKSKLRRLTQQKLIKYLFGNFICFSDNYQQIKNMNSINYICPTLFLYNDINFLKSAQNYSFYLKKESFIEINPDKKLNREEINNMFNKYKLKYKGILNPNINIGNTDSNSNKAYVNTVQSESNIIYPTLFKIYNSTGIYYGEISNNKRNGVGKQFNKKDIFEGIWNDDEIVKGKAIYFSDQGNIIYEGEFKDGLENGYGQKFYPNNRVYKGIFINGKIDGKYEIQKRLEIPDN